MTQARSAQCFSVTIIFGVGVVSSGERMRRFSFLDIQNSTWIRGNKAEETNPPWTRTQGTLPAALISPNTL
jgi:hypothetical protein